MAFWTFSLLRVARFNGTPRVSDSAEEELRFQAVGFPGPQVPRAGSWPVRWGWGCSVPGNHWLPGNFPPTGFWIPARPSGAPVQSWPIGFRQSSIPQGAIWGCLCASC